MDRTCKTTFIKEIRNTVTNEVNNNRNLSDEKILEAIEGQVFKKSSTYPLLAVEKAELVQQIFEKMRGLDVLQPIINDDTVSEIMVNGKDSIFVERYGRVERLEIAFDSTESLEDVIRNIVSKVNRVVNEGEPICDARLADGSRVSVVMPPVAINGPILTIRKFPDKPLCTEQLIKCGTISRQAAETLEAMVRARFNIFICGGTGSGKTTFLNALSDFIPKDERIITIEDAAELRISGIKNLVRMETRNSNSEGKGEVTIRDLIKASLRMRPERIIVGEVRGGEAFDMLQAMNTGHDGSLSTGHANSCKDMLSRLETMVLGAVPLPLEAIRQQIAAGIDIIIHLSKIRDKSRRVMEISELEGYRNREIILNPIFIFEENGEINGKVNGELKRTPNQLVNKWKYNLHGVNYA